MIDLSLLTETTEILANNFKSDEIEELGKIIYKNYDGHMPAGVKNHITMSSKKCLPKNVQMLLYSFLTKVKKHFN